LSEENSDPKENQQGSPLYSLVLQVRFDIAMDGNDSQNYDNAQLSIRVGSSTPHSRWLIVCCRKCALVQLWKITVLQIMRKMKIRKQEKNFKKP
jgi:hypothetical protein